MKQRLLYILFFILGAMVAFVASIGQSMPGYMDADYYYASGIQLNKGFGFTEPFLWNYLDNPTGLPHPSHLYWMPLASIIAAGGMAISGSADFSAARWPFILLYGFLPILSTALAVNILSEKRHAWIAGAMALVPGIFIIYLSIPETFVLYLVLGGLFSLLIINTKWMDIPSSGIFLNAAILGGIAGLMHLSRADGIIWFAGGLAWLIWVIIKRWKLKQFHMLSLSFGIFFLAYLLIMGAWYVRNLELFGSLFPPGNNRTLWLTSYNQIFAYPADKINFSSWWTIGFGNHLQAWWTAAKMNLSNLVAVNGLVVLFPLQILGIWVNRKKSGITFMLIMGISTFMLMTFIFPFSGARGGFLHSASAFQPLLWAASLAGLEVFVRWGERRRNWIPFKAIPRFSVILLLVGAVLTGWFYNSKVLSTTSKPALWGNSYQVYQGIINELDLSVADADTLFMVNNPPGFYVATGKPSIVIPGGGIDEILAAGERYGAKYLILESGQQNLLDLYENPTDQGKLKFLKSILSAKVFCFGCK